MNTDQTRNIQIETTTRCLLGCPACSRTVFSSTLNRPYPKYDIDADELYNFFDCGSGRKFETLSLCGDYGDSIYYPQLFYFIEKFRSTKTFNIYTAGSHQPAEFWHKLVEQLDSRDCIMFGIDGLEDTNHLYRKNSNWNSIMAAVDIVAASPVKLQWDTNIFSFNFDRIDQIRQFAENKGAEFVCKKTSRFGNDSLIPPEQFIDSAGLYIDRYSKESIEIQPQCHTQRAISATGHLRPCGWITAPLTLYKSQLYTQQNLWSIKNQTLDDVMTVLNSWADNIKHHPEAADIICKMKCKPNQLPMVYYE